MKKETFVKAMNSIQKQMEYDEKMAINLKNIYPDVDIYHLTYKNDTILDGIITVLETEVDDNIKEGYQDTWVRWWIFDTDFGQRYKDMKQYDDDGYLIRLYNAGELYDFLTN